MHAILDGLNQFYTVPCYIEMKCQIQYRCFLIKKFEGESLVLSGVYFRGVLYSLQSASVLNEEVIK